MTNLDPYEYDELINDGDWEQDMPSEIYMLYMELIGKYQSTEGPDHAVHSSHFWESTNQVIDKLAATNPEYSRFKIIPQKNGNGNLFITHSNFRSQLMPLISRLATEQGSNATYDIYHNLPNSGMSVAANSNSNSVQNQTNNQTVTIDQSIKEIRQIIEEKLSPEQQEKIKPIVEEYEKNPSKWAVAQKLIKESLEFGEAIATDIIAKVIAQKMGLP